MERWRGSEGVERGEEHKVAMTRREAERDGERDSDRTSERGKSTRMRMIQLWENEELLLNQYNGWGLVWCVLV